MKKVLCIFLSIMLWQISSAQESRRIDLCGEWDFRQSGSEHWIRASVPGCVHTDLMSAGLIDDPFYGRNEKSIQWIGEKDWEYRKTFTISEADLLVSNMWVVLEGVDTYADISVNGLPVGTTDNMFRTWRFDVSDKLKAGDNQLTIRFESVFRHDMPRYLDAPYRLMAWPNNDQSDIWLSVYARKAGYHYGWDWGPRLITAGLHGSVYVESWNDWKIQSVFFKTLSLDKPSAKTGKARTADMQADIEVLSDMECDAFITISRGSQKVCGEKVVLKKGLNSYELPFTIRNPHLWWSNGLGKAHMEEFTVRVDACGNTASLTDDIGIRTAEVIREDDDQGRKMTVRLNGYDVFCKGANWIPIDNFPHMRERRDYAYLLESAALSNMNMIRVWGGGLYESEDFYELCDSLGIMVWQDMAFACGMFPSDSTYLSNVKEEIKDNVRRLRNHPSLVLWCGNNENEISYFEWGWNRTLTHDQRIDYEKGLKKLFYDVIPSTVDAEDGTRYYHPTSPVTGHSGVPYSMGDAHMWSVWKGGWVEEYLKPHNIARFMSEYGFISYPDMFSMKKFIPEWDMYTGSPSMLAHHRAYDDTTRDPNYSDNTICRYMNRYAWVPEKFEDYVYMTQWFQAEAVKVAMEAHRRAKPYCMGTLFWQLNDCWPVVSWSSIDYYGRWKALQYYSRRAYAPVLVSPYLAEDGTVSVKVVSDRIEEFNGTLETYVMGFDGNIIKQTDVRCYVNAEGTKDVFRIESHELDGDTFLYVRLVEGNTIVSENIFFNRYPDEYTRLKPNISIEAVKTDDGIEMILSTDKLARCLYLYTDNENDIFEDNYIDLIPGFSRRIFVKTDKDIEKFNTIINYQTL
ncbi:MAG: glycoside hydrolase family 2 protein [Bacteroidales bacterium]|nr:glycoside hydrolase family 2 protein [Bacteroidales bacterium]